jgi:hypothetical protein
MFSVWEGIVGRKEIFLPRGSAGEEIFINVLKMFFVYERTPVSQ